ncbi:leucine-rich repeat domain-containing protein [Larkinella knui]|nr:leucine-rich repeat domain-containing protein [Larkinella knui]
MSACGLRILLIIGLCGMVSLAPAQDRLLSDSELNGLKTWFPAYRPARVTGVELRGNHSVPNQYETIAELADRAAKSETIQSVQLTVAVLQRGNINRLAELKDLRIVGLEIDTATVTSALWQAVGQLKRLQRLSVSQVNGGELNRAFSTGLVASLAQLPQLEHVQLQIRPADWKPLMTTLASLPRLRKLTLGSNPNMTSLPPELTKVRQLTSLTIYGSGPGFRLPASLGELTKLKDLNLNYLQLDQNREWSFLNQLTELETIRLNYTRLQSVPDLRSLKKLKLLELQGNEQLVIPAENLTGLDALEKIDLSNCKIRQLPSTITQLSGLKELVLNYNPLGELSTPFGSLKQLEVLQLSGCQLRKLPESMGELIHLKKLHLDGNQLDTLNFDIGKLTGLTFLSVYENQLRYLPSSMGRLGALQQLNLSNNKLVQLPETLGDVTSLTYLSLVGNRLTALPSSTGKLVNLTHLEVNGNRLQQLPASIGKLRRLKYLGLGSNKLTQLPDDWGELDSLQSVDLVMNELTVLPGALFRLVQLHSLNLAGNKLTSIPPALGKLTNLTNLNLANNRLVSLPPEIGKLTKLQSLPIADNPLEVLPETIAYCKELTSIFARNTKLKALPEGIVRLTKLQHIDLSGNELTILPAALGNLTDLRSLRLGRTRLLALPESIGRLTHLTSLQIGEMGDVSNNNPAGLHQLPDSLIFCQELMDLQLMNQPGLDGDDTFAKVSKLPKLTNLTLFNCNLERIPAIDWKKFPVRQLSLMHNRLTELPVEILESPKLQQISLYENLLPQPLNTNFGNKDALRLAFSEAGLLTLDKIAKPNRGVATSYVQMAFQKAGQRNWAEAFASFEKAIDYASDTMRIVLYAQRADMHVFRQEYKEAIADYDQSIALANRLTQGVASQLPIQKLQFDQPAVLALRGRANAKAKLGQVDAARADIELALQRLEAIKGNPELKGSLLIEQGRYLTLKNKVTDANASYQKALEEYEKLPYANTGIKLTVVELHLIAGQPDQARTALQKIDKRELQGGNAILEKYLENSIQVLKGEKPDAEVLADLSTFLASHNERIMGWSFELYENWLSRSNLSTEKRAVLQQMTQLTKERLPKMD